MLHIPVKMILYNIEFNCTCEDNREGNIRYGYCGPYKKIERNSSKDGVTVSDMTSI